MGEVISIKRSKDNDLIDQFESACPDVPAHLNKGVKEAANVALGDGVVDNTGPSFGTVCVVLACACVLGVMMVRGVTTRWHNAVESAAVNTHSDVAIPMAAAVPLNTGDVQFDNTNGEMRWQRSRTAWAAYIEHLESDPFYRYVLEEKRRFEQQHP